MPKIGIWLSSSILSSLIIETFSAGSPGPFESIMPSGFRASTLLAEVSAGTRRTFNPKLKRERAMFSFAPKSYSTTVFALFSSLCIYSVFFGTVTEETAFFTLYSFSFKISSSFRSVGSSYKIMPFMVPLERIIFVSARVSIPYSPGIFFSFKKVSKSPSQRKFEGV